MSLFYKTTDKELLSVRIDIFKKFGLPALEKNGFSKSPFLGIWHGEYDRNIGGYSYEFCRLSKQKYLEIINVSIVRGDKWIKIRLNIFELNKYANLIEDFKGINGVNFHLPPNNATEIRLRSDDYKGPPLFYMLFLPEHKIGTYSTLRGYKKKVEELKELIKKDMDNIDSFVKRWYELHKPHITDWEGNRKE